MTTNRVIEVRLIGSKNSTEEFVASMVDLMRRNGFEILKDPAYYPSRKNPDDIRVYTQWIKAND